MDIRNKLLTYRDLRKSDPHMAKIFLDSNSGGQAVCADGMDNSNLFVSYTCRLLFARLLVWKQ